MTNIYGFVAEFNPFHNGHKLFIEQIKETYHPDVLIAVMSGNFVQRGDFSILSKWQRAKIAVDYGVDLVVELPFAYAVQPAQLFAQGAINLLHELGVNNLVFGTENQIDFVKVAQEMNSAEETFQQDYQLSSAENLTKYYQSQGIDVQKLPNQLLGLNYVKQIVEHDYPMAVSTIKRQKSDFSATKIRKLLGQNLPITGLVPEDTKKILKAPVTWDDYFPYLKYQIINQTPEELHQVYQMVEGLEFKLKKEILVSNTYDELLEHVRSKRYTLARIRRLLMYTLINVKETEINNVYKNPYLRVLGFNQIGQKYLNTLKKETNLITRVGKKESTNLELEIRADRIRQLVTQEEEDFGVIPYMEGVN